MKSMFCSSVFHVLCIPWPIAPNMLISYLDHCFANVDSRGLWQANLFIRLALCGMHIAATAAHAVLLSAPSLHRVAFVASVLASAHGAATFHVVARSGGVVSRARRARRRSAPPPGHRQGRGGLGVAEHDGALLLGVAALGAPWRRNRIGRRRRLSWSPHWFRNASKFVMVASLEAENGREIE